MLDSSTIINNISKPENLYAATYKGIIVDAICSQAFLFGEFDMGKSRFRRRDNLCECLSNCGRLTKPGNRFLKGHSNKGQDKYAKEKAEGAPICGCSICDRKTKWNKQNKRWSKYLPGHNLRINNPMKRPEVAIKVSKWMKENCPMKRPEVAAKISGDNSPMRRPEVAKKQSESMKAFGDDHWMKKPEHRERVAKAQSKRMLALGDTHPWRQPEYIKKNSEMNSGPNHPQWKGGISAEPYCDIWLDQDYKQSIKDRDNNQCQNPDCWGTSNKLCGHHIDYNKKNCHPWNIITICQSCNTRANHNRKYWQEFYQQIMTKKYSYEYK